MQWAGLVFIFCSILKYKFDKHISYLQTTLQYHKDDGTGSEILCLSCGHSKSNLKLHKTTYNYNRKRNYKIQTETKDTSKGSL